MAFERVFRQTAKALVASCIIVPPPARLNLSQFAQRVCDIIIESAHTHYRKTVKGDDYVRYRYTSNRSLAEIFCTVRHKKKNALSHRGCAMCARDDVFAAETVTSGSARSRGCTVFVAEI